MSRLKISFPQILHFSTQLSVRISDINYGNHLGHDRMITMIHEARMLFFRSLGYEEFDVEGVGTIIADLAITYQSEAFYGDVLEFDIAVQELSAKSFQLYYRVKLVSDKEGEKRGVVALAKTAVVFFDFDERKSEKVPKQFIERLNSVERKG